MNNICGKYQLVACEQFLEYLIAHGVPEDDAKLAVNLRPIMEVKFDGKKVSFKSDHGLLFPTTDLILNEQITERFPRGFVFKSTTTLVDDTLIVISRAPDRTICTRTMKFSETELIVTTESSNLKSPIVTHYYIRI